VSKCFTKIINSYVETVFKNINCRQLYTMKNAQYHLNHNLFNYSTYISCMEKKTLVDNYLRRGAYKNAPQNALY